MFRIDDPSASATLPAPEAVGTEAYFTEGAPGVTAATLVRASWLNMIQEELRAIVVAGGLTPLKTTYNQVLNGIKALIQSNAGSYALDTGTANAYVLSVNPPVIAYTDGLKVRGRVAYTNTGASTLTVANGSAVGLVGLAHSALQGGEMFAGGYFEAEYNSTLSKFVLLWCSGAPEQIAPATASQHAVQAGQLVGIVGSMRNAKMNVAAASASATFTADEIIVETALGGLKYGLSNYGPTINLATTGAGGMDTGSAPVSGWVALYAIFKPSTGTASILATNATSAIAPSVYGGANMPAGYTASALLSVWRTDSSGQFVQGYQNDRRIFSLPVSVLSSSTVQAARTSLSIAGAAPKNAVKATLLLSATCTAASTAQTMTFQADAIGAGEIFFSATTTISGITSSGNGDLNIAVAQTVYYTALNNGGGTPTFNASISAYEI